jgi:hypothetical protein
MEWGAVIHPTPTALNLGCAAGVDIVRSAAPDADCHERRGWLATWLAAGLEGLDDDHAAAAAGAGVDRRLRRICVVRRLDRRWGQVQELTHGLNRFGAIAFYR